jgi:CBS domain-containing protein
METNVVGVDPSIKVIKVARLMVSKDIGRVPVVDEGGKLVGIIDREDIARLLIR